MLEFLRALVAMLDAAGVPYMLAGSVASSFHGEPRATQDIDLVVAFSPGTVRRFYQALDVERFYMDLDTAMTAVRARTQFNLIDMDSAWKCDLIVRKDTEFARVEFGRRQRVAMDGLTLWVASPEDVVLSKLVWSARSGGSEKQRRDVASVLSPAPPIRASSVISALR